MKDAGPIRICLIGDYDKKVIAHCAIPIALELASRQMGCAVEGVWLGTAECEKASFDLFHGFWAVPGSPYRSMAGALHGIQFARENRRPFLGTCGGFQHAIIEYARNVCQWQDADHAESSPDASQLVISRLSCSLVEVESAIQFAEESRLRDIYADRRAREAYHCNFGVNPATAKAIFSKELRIAARDDDGDIRAFELKGHPFYFGTLYQPERSALRGEGHPLISEFVKAAATVF